MAHVLAKKIREAILQAALEGKITETLSSDTSPSESIKKFQEEKEILLGKKNMRDRNKFDPIKEEELPFEIPNTWQWIRINDIGIYKKGPFGSALTKGIFVPKSKDSVKVYEQKNAIQKNWKLGDYYIKRDYYETKMSGFSVEAGDIIVSCAGTIGETYILPEGIETGIINQALMRINIVPSLNTGYFLLVFDHILKEEAKKNSGGTAIKNIPPFEVFKAMPIPLPPIEEQARIVARVEELMVKIDEYEKLENELVELKKNFPGDMKSAVLQAAMQGRLTEQLESDGDVNTTVEEMKSIALEQVGSKKLIKNKTSVSIAEDEIPFDIPNSWQWVRLGNLVKVISGTSYDKSNIVSNGLRIIRGGNLENLEVVKKDNDIFLPKNEFFDSEKIIKKNDIVVVASTGSISGIGRPSFMDNNPNDEMQIGAFLRIVRPYGDKMYKYIKYIFMSDYYRSHISNVVAGIGIRNLKEEHITALPIPLPPIKEQRRIVEKLDKILPLCEELKKEIA